MKEAESEELNQTKNNKPKKMIQVKNMDELTTSQNVQNESSSKVITRNCFIMHVLGTESRI